MIGEWNTMPDNCRGSWGNEVHIKHFVCRIIFVLKRERYYSKDWSRDEKIEEQIYIVSTRSDPLINNEREF